MTDAPPKDGRGRHAKPPSEFEVLWKRLVEERFSGRGRRRLAAIGVCAASLIVLGAIGVAGLAVTPDEPSRATAAGGAAKPSGSAASQDAQVAGVPDETAGVLPYLQAKDTGKKAAKHVKDVQRTGDLLRVYTDLQEGDENSEPAVSLCEWTTEYLEGGGEKPRVFVHGESDGNGSVVLANKQGDKDDCKVGETP